MTVVFGRIVGVLGECLNVDAHAAYDAAPSFQSATSERETESVRSEWLIPDAYEDSPVLPEFCS